MLTSMTLSSLLLCVDAASVAVLERVLEELGIQVESCLDPVRASVRLAQQHFDLIILDCEKQADVTSLLHDTRTSRLNDATLAVAVVAGQENIREMFSLGVNFVLYKPVSYERALSSLRAAQSVLFRDKRKKARAPVHAHAIIDYAGMEQARATLVDLAEDGMAVNFGKKLPPTCKVYFQFQLPGQMASVRLSGQIVWQDWNGRAGIQFVDVPKSSRKLLTEFLSVSLPADSQQERLPGVTVEVEEPLQLATVSVAEQTHGLENTKYTAHEVGVQERSETPAEIQADSDNRRTQARYACRLGAEVYRTGTSVPNHCCLTDLSSGGCYLEVPLPFPMGAEVEIVVRTHELKLRLRGKVLAAHPGYGMGIAFELKTKEEQMNVRKLTEFVALTTPSSN